MPMNIFMRPSVSLRSRGKFQTNRADPAAELAAVKVTSPHFEMYKSASPGLSTRRDGHHVKTVDRISHLYHV